MRKAFEIQRGDILIASRNIVIRLFWGWGSDKARDTKAFSDTIKHRKQTKRNQ